MGSIKDRISDLRGAGEGEYWKDRVLSEIDYVRRIGTCTGDDYGTLIDHALTELESAKKEQGVIGKGTVLTAEDTLSSVSEAAKKYKVLCASHAHIDMNWMWGWHETVAVTIETFRTVLKLMQEYPAFTFSQSQASVYKIIEDYDPRLLNEIKSRVHEGRWEVTASQWVEGDKNIAGGESLMRHLLYTRAYLSELLDIPKTRMNIDFEPDTFGHNANMPEVLSSAGVKYYYHCRGSNDRIAYRWSAPSGASVIAYQEPRWYNSAILPNLAEFAPGFCEEFNTDTALAVYGVGDHGGGPTRRDIERIIDMQTWPIYPQIEFGTYAGFFNSLENADLPDITGERNFIFVGCYTSQTRIKMANRLAEAGLNEAERYCSFSDAVADAVADPVADPQKVTLYDRPQFIKAWRDTLFNHFHDILPGSGVTETREYALGKFQDTMATVLSSKARALQAIAAEVDTRSFAEAAVPSGYTTDVSEGAGVGYKTDSYEISRTERGSGAARAFTLFNPLPEQRSDSVELTVWDWQYGDDLEVVDSQGALLPYQVLNSGINSYWAHRFTTVQVAASVPGIGYSTIVVQRADKSDDSYLENPLRTPSNLVHTPVSPVLENDEVRIAFHPHELRIISFFAKSTNQELVNADEGGACFRLLTEEGEKTWTAWVVGKIIDTEELIDHAYLIDHCLDGETTRWLEYRVSFASSEMTVKFQLNTGSTALKVHAAVKWRELGSVEAGVPQLDFRCAHEKRCSSYLYDIPFGTIERQPSAQDRPAVSWGAAAQANLLFVTKEKNGYRGDGIAMHLPLIRATTNPDPYPEVGDHDISFWIGFVESTSAADLITVADALLNPFSAVSAPISSGTLPAVGSFLSMMSTSVRLAAVKKAEDGGGLVLRLYESEGSLGKAEISTSQAIKKAIWVDADEGEVAEAERITINDTVLKIDIPPYAMRSIVLRFS